MNAYVSCVGCEQRELDTQRVINYLHKNGINILNDPTNVDYVFVITCGVDLVNERHSVDKLKEISGNMGESAKLIVGGCLPSINPSVLEQFDVYHTFTPRSIETLDSLLRFDSTVGNTVYPNKSIYDTQKIVNEETTARSKFEIAKNGYKVRIAEGCLGECTYCMIREATGLLKSDSIDNILLQIERGVQQGEKTIMLMAGDTGSYGQEIGTDFATLLGNIVKLHGDFQLYVHDFGVNWLINSLPSYQMVFEEAEMIKRIGGITFPIQSGSDKVLQLMRRKYNRRDVISVLRKVKKYSFDIGTHIMVGFPGENEDDFNETLNLLSEVDLDFVTCFPYSEKPMTVSASFPNKLSRELVEERLERIMYSFDSKIKVMK